ncbi:cupin-like domain-containing protein [Gordonia mangrovi]|nr:cupin-like domain-containing protein [Gordonia mangrovi]UVF79229.1 cupin-like domain-containing protein [Gordonia mangrovi]
MSTTAHTTASDLPAAVAVPRHHAADLRVRAWHSEPRVIVDAGARWPALRRWTPDYLTRVAGDRDVRVREATGPPTNLFQRPCDSGWIAFADYLNWVLDIDTEVAGRYLGDHTDLAHAIRLIGDLELTTSYYLNGQLAAVSPQLADDVRIPDWLATPIRSVNLWCGVIGTSCGLHCDLVPNCNAQVVGHKHFSLYPPDQTRLLYRIGGRTHCRFDPSAPDFAAFPRARRATRWECTLAPGEALYIPPGWYHQVTVVSGWSVNVNVFWERSWPHGLLAPALWPHLLRLATAQARQRLSR